MNAVFCKQLVAALAIAWATCGHATPAVAERADVVFSHPSGFHEQGFSLRLSHPDTEASILFTLDGSDPDPSNLRGSTYRYKNLYSYRLGDPFGPFLEERLQTHRYAEPIRIVDRSPQPDRYSSVNTTLLSGLPGYFPPVQPLSPSKQSLNRYIERTNGVFARTANWWQGVSGMEPSWAPQLPGFQPAPPAELLKATVVRAAAFRDGQALGGVSTATYFIMPRSTFALPVVSIVAPEPSLFGYEQGILVAGQTHDRFREETGQQRALGHAPANWQQRGVEIPASFAYFSDRITSDRASVEQDIGVRVHGGATRGAPSKSLRLYARKKYGKATMRHAFFGETPQKYKRLLLRNSGNDFYNTMMRDGATQRMMGGLRFDTQAYQPTVVFLNGEYWGLLNLREHLDKHYLARVYGVDEDRLDVMEADGADEGDAQRWEALMAFVDSHSLAVARHYAQVADQIDIDNFTDYIIANVYAANHDWPHNNIRFWRLRTGVPRPDVPAGHDGRWRWMMFDTDQGFRDANAGSLHRLALQPYNREDARTRTSIHVLFRALLQNPQFRQAFVVRFSDLLNTDLSEARTTAVVAGVRALIEAEMPRHQQRWKFPASVEDWSQRVDHLTHFAQSRPAVQRQHMAQALGLKGDYRLEVRVSDPTHGRVQVNTIALAENAMPWSGRYFKGVPLVLEAAAAPCFAFSHWDGLPKRPARALLRPQADLSVTAVFRPTCGG